MSVATGLEALLRLVGLSALIDTIVSAFKIRSKWEWVTMGLGVFLCLMAHLDMFTLLEMPLVFPGVVWLGVRLGEALTGVVVSRGADYLLVLWGQVSSKQNGVTINAGTKVVP